MDGQNHVSQVSILNDNDCPSFVVRQGRPSITLDRWTQPRSPRKERPSLLRHSQFTRNSSFSSLESPPLFRFNSSSSKSGSSYRSMDSTPSPTTPAYNFSDPTLLPLPYDPIFRPDVAGFLNPTSAITPLMETQLMIAPSLPDLYSVKAMQQISPIQYPILPAPLQPEILQMPTPTSSHNSANNSISNAPVSNPSPANSSVPAKKNKYPCPYSQTHNCSATFTTSGHAARHGKKHTGEKGVHCPVCDKAFTRKDNMKQHERTHKGSISGNSEDANPRRSKAQVTRDAQKGKELKQQDSTSTSTSDTKTQSSLLPSPLSEVISLAPRPEMPMVPIDETTYYPEPVPTLLNPVQMIADTVPSVSFYPTMINDPVLSGPALISPPISDKMDVAVPPFPTLAAPPPLVRGFSDLDTLAQAAESFDPYYQQPL